MCKLAITFTLIVIMYSHVSCAYLKSAFKKGKINKQEMVVVPAGYFLMGDNYYKNDTENPPRQVFLKSFKIDKTEVTYFQYQKCVEAGFCSPPGDTISWYKVYKEKAFLTKYANYPVSYISWDQAARFCKWHKKRLPTEEEWEKAARGTTGFNFPWGLENADNIKSPQSKGQFAYYSWILVFDDDCNCMVPTLAKNSTGTSPVGHTPLGASPYGVMDMAGNVWEWVEGQDSASMNAELKIIKGGSYTNRGSIIQSFLKRFQRKKDSEANIGFRCACSIN